MTAHQERQLRTLTTFLLGGALAGILYNVAQGRVAPINLLLGVIYGGFISGGVGAYEVFVVQGAPRLWLRGLPFGVSVLVRSLVYAAIMFPLLYFDLGVLMMGLRPDPSIPHFWRAVGYSVGVSLLFNFLLQISYIIGPRTLARLVAGRYRSPREEKRFVLFVDVVGSTAAAERLGNRKSHMFLDRVFRIASGPVLDFRGEIYLYVGDEMIVTWPAESGASNGRALHCFLAMRQALAAAAAGFRRDFDLTPQIRGSLHFGVVVVGEIGDIKRHIVLHGDVMNVAARLEEASRAVPGGFVVSGPAADALGPVAGVVLANLGTLGIRGRAQPLEAFGLA
jgi:adenylate cyclase